MRSKAGWVVSAGSGPRAGTRRARSAVSVRCSSSGGSSPHGISLDDIRKASENIDGHAKRTPVFTNETISRMAKVDDLHFKMEVFQKTGSFKIRGALNAIMNLSEEEAKKGVVTHSSGNHAQAVALAAKIRGIPAHIVVPENAPRVKVAAIEHYGGKLHFCGLDLEDRESTMKRVQEEQGGCPFIPPFNAVDTICGQGTIGLELMEQTENKLDAIVVPVSGGGMISGIAIAAKAINPDIKIIAAEPLGVNEAADIYASKRLGELLALPKTKTLADGLQARLGDLTWPVVKSQVDDVIVVTEKEIVAAMKLIYERMKVVVEPSGAVGLAAVLNPDFQQKYNSGGGGGGGGGKMANVGVILCGGNVDLSSVEFWESWTRRWQSLKST